MEPAVDDRFFRRLVVVPVAQAYRRTFDAEFAGGLGRNFLAVGADKHDIRMEDGLSDRAVVLGRLLVRHGHAVDADLGEAVALAEDDVLFGAPGVHELDGNGGAAVDEEAHVGEIGRFEGGRVVPHLVEGRHAEDHGATLALNVGDRALGVEFAFDDDAAARVEERRQEDEEAARVVHGREHGRHVALAEAPADDGVDAVPEHLPVRDDGAFGFPRGARGVEDEERIVLGEVGGPFGLGRGAAGDHGLIVADRVELCSVQGDEALAGHAGLGLLDQFGELRSADQHLRGAVVAHVLELVGLEPPVEGHEDGADLREPVHQVDKVDAVLGEDADAVSLLYAQLAAQVIGHAAGALVELPIGEAALARHVVNGFPIRSEARPSRQDLAHMLVAHRKPS